MALRLEKKLDAARTVLERMLVAYPADTLYAAELAYVNSASAACAGRPRAAPSAAATEEASFADA